MIRNSLFAVLLLFLVGCAGEFNGEDALATIASEEEFETAFCAPIHIGKEVLTGDNYKNPKEFVEKKYGELVQAGLVTAQIGKSNSWRTLLEVVLTPDGEKLLNQERTDKHLKNHKNSDLLFVAVCNLHPEAPFEVKDLGDGIMELTYNIVERDITPFGKFLGYKEGKIHPHSRKFKKGTFGWNLLPIE